MRVESADIDNDGDLDLICSDGEEVLIGWYENLGSGIYSIQRFVGNGEYATYIETADVDGDGDQDILFAAYYGDFIGWYRNEGDGSFAGLSTIDDVVDGPGEIRVEDVDEDGDLDVLAVAKFESNVLLYLNDGTGEFTEELIDDIASGPVVLTTADLDGDGDNDIIVGLESSNDLVWYENLGAGSYDSPVYISETTFDINDVESGDLDEDGDLDVVISSHGENLISWFANNGDGTFGPEITIAGFSTPTAMLLSDVEGNGSLDVYAYSSTSMKLSWFANDGDGMFSEAQLIDEDFVWRGFTNGDFDQDGDEDLAVVSNVDSRLVIYDNEFLYEEQVSGQLFYDFNENGVYDSLEVGLGMTGVISSPESDYTFTFEDGRYIMNFTPDFDTYVIEPQDVPHWSLSTAPSFYEVPVDTAFTIMDSLDFGFLPDSSFTLIEPTLTGGFPRCNTVVNYWVDFRNNGTTLPSGFLKVVLDDSIVFIEATVEPDSIVGQEIYWHYDSLLYFSNQDINMHVQMPTVEMLGESMNSCLLLYEVGPLGDTLFETGDTLQQTLLCAYDPNDKNVKPSGIGDLGFIVPSTEILDYTIRFQNTGTDTALTIVVRDQLDPNLDWSTFEPIAFSHDVHIMVEDYGELVFTFEDIMLPDSNTNELESHGFIRYKIRLNEDLELGTNIYNQAGIYFDANDPIFTNTTVNTIACWNNSVLIIEGDPDNSICYEDREYGLLSDKEGGVFAGTGVIGDGFNPSVAGMGEHEIIYTRIDEEEDCFYQDTLMINVVDCLALPEHTENKITVYPNPFKYFTTVRFETELTENHAVVISNIVGQEVYRNENVVGTSLEIRKKELGVGVYILSLYNSNSEKLFSTKLLVE